MRIHRIIHPIQTKPDIPKLEVKPKSNLTIDIGNGITATLVEINQAKTMTWPQKQRMFKKRASPINKYLKAN